MNRHHPLSIGKPGTGGAIRLFLLLLTLTILTRAATPGPTAGPLRFDFAPTPREALLAGAGGPLPKTAPVPQTAAPPVVDGRLDDPAWENAASQSDFSLATPPTVFRACCTQDTLFLGVTGTNAPGRPPRTDPVPRDGAVYHNDCVEIWIHAPTTPPARYHLIVDAAGAVYDSRNEDAAVNPDWQGAVHRDEMQWTAEISIPRATLGLEAWPAELRFNLGRYLPGYGRAIWHGDWGGAENSSLRIEGGAAPKQAAAAAVPLPLRSTDTIAITGRGLRVACARPYARPGERFIEIDLAIAAEHGVLPPDTRLAARLRAARSERILVDTVVTPARTRGRIFADLRAAEVEAATLDLALTAQDRQIGAATLLLRAEPPPRPFRPGERVRIPLSIPTGIETVNAEPITFGWPVPEGALWDTANVRLVDGSGAEIPHQIEVAGRWAPQGAIKWLRFDALVDSAAGCFLEARPQTAARTPPEPVRLTEAGDRILIATGGVEYVLARGPSPIAEIRLHGRTVAAVTGARGLYVVDQRDRLGRASAEDETVRIESRGPVAACVRFEGFYRDDTGAELARHITRVECIAGRSGARITHTLVLCNDTEKLWLKDVGWEFTVAPGAQPEALFAPDREHWQEVTRVPLPDPETTAHMIQDQHYYYAHGTNHCAIREVRNGETREIRSGTECGDWAALTGTAGGLMLNCRESARQHPTEFEVGANRIVLRLFSNRAGDELDFRAPTLVKKWHLGEWLDKVLPARFRYNQENELTPKLRSNALGWSKTHDLLVMPLAAAEAPAALARVSRLQRDPVYARADPEWLYETRALGRLHPRDSEHFPEIEDMLDHMIAEFFRIRQEWGEYGFMDYPGYAPHAGGNLAGSRPRPKRNYVAYSLPHGAWLLYARGGERQAREYAHGLTRLRNDSQMAHWGGAEKVRGYYAACGSDRSDGSAIMDLPFYWGTGRTMNFCPNVTMVNDLTWGWYLTGDRRLKDCLQLYIDALKANWTVGETKRTWRITWNFGRLVHLYAFSWDPAIAAMAALTGEAIHDPDCAFGITADTRVKAYTTTYKIWIDLRDIIMAWRIFGDEHYRVLADKIAAHVWGKRFLSTPKGYDCADGIVADYLYHEKGDISVVESLRLKLEQLVAAYRTEGPCLAQPYMAFYFEGVPLAQDILRRHAWGATATASWAACEDFGSPIAFCTRKSKGETVAFRANTSTDDGLRSPYRLEAVSFTNAVKGVNSLEVIGTSAGWQGCRIEIPKDAPATDLVMTPPNLGAHQILSDRPCPLVLHAPSYWRWAPEKEPVPRIYFKLPEGESDGHIFFEGNTRLYDPDGTLYGPETGQSGWVALPPEKAGLWSFVSTERMLVRGRNLPPFFAFERPENYFEPAVEWQREGPRPAPVPFPAAATYVPGALGQPGDHALYLHRGRRFALAGGDPLPDGSGRRFIRTRAGTVEFFFQPTWGSFDDPGKPRYAPLLEMPTAPGKSIKLTYKRNPDTPHWFHTHALECYLPVTGIKGWLGIRTHRRTLIEPYRWIHIALVWGHLGPDRRPAAPEQGGRLHALIFVDGKTGMCSYEATGTYSELSIDGRIESMIMTARAAGAVDELRVSDFPRYTADFVPPARDRELQIDEHTLALFHFNGDTTGLSHGQNESPPVSFQP